MTRFTFSRCSMTGSPIPNGTHLAIRRFLVAFIAANFLAVPVQAQWTVTVLHPAGANQSQARSLTGLGHQVGYSQFGTTWNAGMWSGTNTSFVNLHPGTGTGSFAHRTDGVQQVGDYNPAAGQFNAALWSGSAASFVNLHPTGAISSFATDVQNGVQVGRANVGGVFQASMWTGTAASWTSLHPTGAIASALSTIDNGQQGGFARFADNIPHAGLWSGTAASFVDLHPGTGPSDWLSEVTAMHGGQQVGNYGPLSSGFHAALWTGTAASYINLMPAGGLESNAIGVHSGFQVGYTNFGSGQRAGIWNGTAASWENLHDFLPTSGGELWLSSFARDVWLDGNDLYVVGVATEFTPFGARQRAILWSMNMVPEPSSGLLVASASLAMIGFRRRRKVV